MSYVLKSNTRRKSNLTPGIKIVGVCLITLAILYAFFPRFLPGFFIALARPFWNIEQEVRYGDVAREELTRAYLELAENSARNNAVLAENEELKGLLGRTPVEKPLLATILKKPPTSAYDTFVLDVGADHGVEAGDTIYALGTVPVGEIAEVFAHTAKAKLYSSSGEKFDIVIGSSTIHATAIGKGGGYFEVSLPRDTKIQRGDHVLVPTLHDSFVGVVEGVASEPSEPFSKILFRQPISMYELRWVIIDTHGTQQ